MNTTLSLTVVFCILVLPLTACMPGFGEDAGPEYVETYYIDAPNGFAIGYPAAWGKEKRAGSVIWHPPPGSEAEAEVMAKVTSFSPSDVPGGYDRMLSDFTAAHPGFVLASKEQRAGEEEGPALRVLGRTPSRAILALFITSRLGAFIVEFSAPPQRFDSYRPIFEEMADSFRVLD